MLGSEKVTQDPTHIQLPILGLSTPLTGPVLQRTPRMKPAALPRTPWNSARQPEAGTMPRYELLLCVYRVRAMEG
jgi:hypothetical protein